MSYCPKCKCEYEDYASKCTDCDVALVDKIEAKQRTEVFKEVVGEHSFNGESKIEEVYIANTEEEALSVKSLLDYNGIESLIKRLDVGSYMNITYGFSTSGIKIYVLDSDVEDANNVLKASSFIVDEEDGLADIQDEEDLELIAEADDYTRKRRRIMQTYLLFSAVSALIVIAIIILADM